MIERASKTTGYITQTAGSTGAAKQLAGQRNVAGPSFRTCWWVFIQ